MENIQERLVSWLFKTNAVRVSPPSKPFWYTSGTIGPYYINTHFVYGDESKANSLLGVIDAVKDDKFACPAKVLNETIKNYNQTKIYKELIDGMCEFIKTNINIDEVDYISGGERRDWFFSLITAKLLNKPHLTIYKDLDFVVFDCDKVEDSVDLKGKNVLHIADLITEASSYERAWIPAIRSRGGEMKWSIAIVDRKQGGGELLAKQNIKSFSLVNVDDKLFLAASNKNYISEEQCSMVLKYISDPKGFVVEFMKDNPEFLEDALKSDVKTKERALLYLKNL